MHHGNIVIHLFVLITFESENLPGLRFGSVHARGLSSRFTKAVQAIGFNVFQLNEIKPVDSKRFANTALLTKHVWASDEFEQGL